MPIIIENVSVFYSRNTPLEIAALKDVNLRIERGEFVGILGEKGAGKSTLIKLFNGLLRPDSGKITVNGLDPSSKKVKSRVGMVFQQPADQLFCRTVYNEIAFGPLNFGFSREETEERVFESLEAVSLDHAMLSRDPLSLSGGEMQRVALAGALALRPDYLVLDEPITGLDPAGKKEILDTLKKIKDKGTTVITVTHNLKGFFPLLERIVLVKEGRISFQGSRKEYMETENVPLPPVASMMRELKSRGIPVNSGVFTVEEALEEILRVKSVITKENAEKKPENNQRITSKV